MRATSRHFSIALTALALIAAGSNLHAQKSDDRARIAELAAQAVSGEWQAQQDAVAALVEEHGPFAVNGLMRWIGSQSDVDARVLAVCALRRLGPQATLPLLAGLHAGDAMVRRNICLALAEMEDGRARAALFAVAQHDQDELAATQARQALELLGGPPRGDASSALAAMATEACSGWADDLPEVFFWNGKEIAHRPVSAALLGPAYAKLFAEDALCIDPCSAEAKHALVSAYQAMKQAIEAGDEGSADWEPELQKLADLLALGGADTGVSAEEPAYEAEPMAGADTLINSEDKRLRYKSALALAGSQATEEVVSTLASALSESAVRQILVVDADRDELNGLVALLTGRDSFAIGATSGAQGLVRAKAQPFKDAIIVRSSLKDVPADQFVENLSRDVRTQGVPVILVAEESEMERVQALLGSKVQAVVPAPITLAVIKPALDAAFEQAKLNDERMEAEQFSRLAAEALASLDAAALAPVAPALVGALGRADEIQIPVLGALAKVGAGEAQGKVASLFADGGASPEARVAAAQALAGILEQNDAQPATMSALLAALAGEDAPLRSAAARVIGKARSVSAEACTRLLLEHGVRY
ncbi:MAG: hypothetical protein HY812_20275 [Planctomycetes bacterium]|nr:hypothetical protein [Planctomycetota bacterium]